jgi:hypothetical protein
VRSIYVNGLVLLGKTLHTGNPWPCFLLILMGKTMGIPASMFPSNPVILVILGMVHCPTCRLVATVVQNSQHNKTTRGETHPAMPVQAMKAQPTLCTYV